MNLLVIIVSFIYYSHDCYQWIWNMDYCIVDGIMELWIVFSFHDSNDNCFFTSDDSSEIDFKSFCFYQDWSLLFHWYWILFILFDSISLEISHCEIVTTHVKSLSILSTNKSWTYFFIVLIFQFFTNRKMFRMCIFRIQFL